MLLLTNLCRIILSRVTLAVLGVLIISQTLMASNAMGQAKASGFELALTGSEKVYSGKDAHFRGVAYRVMGLAQLRKLPNAKIRSRLVSDSGNSIWKMSRADVSGFFEIAIPIPKTAEVGVVLEVSVGASREERVFEFPLSIRSEVVAELMTDRNLYEPGETIHAWAQFRDVHSKRPLVNVSTTLSIAGTAISQVKRTTAAHGVVSASAPIPKGTREGSYEFVVESDGEKYSSSYRVGTRSYDRLLAKLSVSPATANPNQKISISALVTEPSGAPVRNANVKIVMDGQVFNVKTDANGRAVIRTRAPVYMDRSRSVVSVKAEVQHPAFGQIVARSKLLLTVPLTMSVYAVPGNGGLVPEVSGTIYFHLNENDGKVPPIGTSIVVTGAAFPGRRATGKSDKHGIVKIATRLPKGASSGEENEHVTSVVVHVQGAAATTIPMEIGVSQYAEVVPHISRAVVAPGEPVSIQISRRPSALKVPVIVDLLAGEEIVESFVLKPGVNSLRSKAPKDRLGVFIVRARPLHQKSVAEGSAGFDAFLVRPAKLSFPSLKMDRKSYNVKGKAKLHLMTNSNSARSWVALVVRDLSAHAGEKPFQRWFLDKAIEQAVLDPTRNAADTLLRTALSDYMYVEERPGLAPPLLDPLGRAEEAMGLDDFTNRGVLRDPFPVGEELSRRGVGEVMIELEALVMEAMHSESLAEIVLRKAGASRFRTDVLGKLDEVPLTLGDDELTLSALRRADNSFHYDNVGRRIARQQLVKLLVSLMQYLDPGDDASLEERAEAQEPMQRWLSRMVQHGLVNGTDLRDPWGNLFVLKKTSSPAIAIAIQAANLELVSLGPDGKLGTKDDIANPFARAIPEGTVYSVASGEDMLMDELSKLSPGPDVLLRLLAAFQRVSAEVMEEESGDAVGASMSEGYGSIGHGGGTGSGYGSGSGRGGVRGRSQAPLVRIGAARGRGRGIGGFGNVLREKFPATLFFSPALEVNTNGITEISIPLNDGVTTYLVEAIVWSEDGFSWSAKTKFQVEKETVIDVPLPRYAAVGDVIELPVRVSSRSSKARQLTVSAFTSSSPHKILVSGERLRVLGNDTALYPLRLKLSEPMKGGITIGVKSDSGVALDAVKRQIEVRKPARRVRKITELLTSGKGTMTIEVEKNAIPREGSILEIRVGEGVFEDGKSSFWSAWATGTENSIMVGSYHAQASTESAALAASIAIAWSNSQVSDDSLSQSLKLLTEDVARTSTLANTLRLTREASILLHLSPVSTQMSARKGLGGSVRSMLRALRKSVQVQSAAELENTHALALSAAALAFSAPKNSKQGFVRELVRRLRQEQISVGDATWVTTKEGGHATSALMALAELELGERKRSLALLRTLSKLHLDFQRLDPWTLGLAQVVVGRLSIDERPSSLVVRVDGKPIRIAPQKGVIVLPVASLGKAGKHQVTLDLKDGASSIYYLKASTEYGLPWSDVPERAGSIAVSIVGEVGHRNAYSGLSLVVHNRSPRTIAKPILEVELPAGAELDLDSEKRLLAHLQAKPSVSRGTLTLAIHGLSPGASTRIPLPLRWTVSGHLQGLGIASYPADKVEDLRVLSPRVVKIGEGKGTP